MIQYIMHDNIQDAASWLIDLFYTLYELYAEFSIYEHD